jgi:polysaccharide pyruvyl transferase WcaK-like protein
VIKIIIYGVNIGKNLGGPSLILGVVNMVQTIYKDSEIIIYQRAEIDEIAVKDIPCVVKKVPYLKPSSIFIECLKYKFGLKPKNIEKRLLFESLKNADIVANVFGICFHRPSTKKSGYPRVVKSTLSSYDLGFCAKILGTKSIKCTASYGPLMHTFDLRSAKIAARFVFDKMYAREKESKKHLEQVAPKMNIIVTPDLANYMDIKKTINIQNRIGISISHKIIRQWEAKESYIEIIVNLCNYIIKKYQLPIILIPNEINNDNTYNDNDVATDIFLKVHNKELISILNVEMLTAVEIKQEIAECKALIASRYHSCVAALSAGVPLIVIGWHNKYQELMELYKQEKWLFRQDNCDTNGLIKMFDEFLYNLESIHKTLEDQRLLVKSMLLNEGKGMFSK